MTSIHYCISCKQYTLQTACICGKPTTTLQPLKYAPHDKYAHYRRQAQHAEHVRRGYL